MKSKKCIAWVVYSILLVVIAVVLVLVVRDNGIYPSGDDTFYHIYRGEYVYKSIKSGDFFPKLDKNWYNGVELMRFWPPMCAYVMAFLDMLCGGDIYAGYLAYIVVTFILSALSFAFIGERIGRPYLGMIFGIVWYFMPNNLYALFAEGNLPRVFSMIILPLFIYHIYDFQERKRALSLMHIAVSFFFLCMCHLGYAGMIIISVLIYLIVYGIVNRKQFVISVKIILSILLGFMMAGFYVIPSLTNAASTDSFDKSDAFFQSAFVSLNPVGRVNGVAAFYFGLAAFLIILIGAVGSYGRSIPGFLTALIIFFLTTKTGQLVVKILPGHEMLWMLRFISIALCFMFMSLMYWDKLKKKVMAVLIALLVIDIIPSYKYIVGEKTKVKPEKRLESIAKNSLLDKAKEICDQRIALLDLSTLDATGAYMTASYGDSDMSAFGAGWEAAVTSDNIVMLNRAVEEGYFPYIFDRALDLGCDTVLIRMDRIKLKHFSLGVMEETATAQGYELVASNSLYRLYHRETGYKYFGNVTEYTGIGIGKDARTISLAYPDVMETSDPNINHYTVSELSKYKVVYLANFEYDDRELAETHIKNLADAGIRVVILADRIPEDKTQRINTFLGVSAQRIEFENGYPLLNVRNYGWLDLDLFPNGHAKWNTYYLNGLDDVYGTFVDNDLELAFYGTKYNDNIVFLALNLPYYFSLTRDRNAEKIIADFLTIPAEELPNRKIVPLDIDFEKDKIIIRSDSDEVNTTLSYHDIYSGRVYESNNLAYVNAGETVIRLTAVKPYLSYGMTLAGIVLLAGYVHVNLKYQRKIDESDH